MKTSKAIRLIKAYLIHYTLLDNLTKIGLSPDTWHLGVSDLCEIIFDIDTDRNDIDEVLEDFCKYADEMKGKISNFNDIIPDELLTSTAIDIYSDWKAYSQRQPIKA
jgi:hypothetical protein